MVWKSAGTPAYQLAVVVDDAAAGVTEVVRGDDLVPSTPRQLLLYAALGLTPPRFAHVPLVVGRGRPAAGQAARRHPAGGAAGRGRAAGGAAGAAGVVVRLAGGAAPVAARRLLPRFRLAAVPRQPFLFERIWDL